MNVYTISPKTKRELKSAIMREHFNSLEQVRVSVYDKSFDMNGNRTAHVALNGSFEDDQGNMYIVHYETARRVQTGCSGDRLDGALNVLADAGFNGVSSHIKNARLTCQSGQDQRGRTVVIHIENEVL